MFDRKVLKFSFKTFSIRRRCHHTYHTLTGELIPLDNSGESLLSKRELDVLRLVSQGAKSVQIANALCISVHTVSRHRQNIIEKLQVSNSTDACTLAKKMQLI